MFGVSGLLQHKKQMNGIDVDTFSDLGRPAFFKTRCSIAATIPVRLTQIIREQTFLFR
jgi:hypothetical protein